MKKYIKSSEFLEDRYLPLEHSIDTALSEAYKLSRSLNAQHETALASKIEGIAIEFNKLQNEVRFARKFDYQYCDEG